MKTYKIIQLIIISILSMIATSCSKEWLDDKPQKSLVVPETVKDLQAILDDQYTMNQGYSVFGLRSNQLVYISDNDLGQLADEEREMYKWEKQINYMENGFCWDWVFFYKLIRSANLVLDGSTKLSDKKETKGLIGQAHFFRAIAYYNLAQIFCNPYTENKANTDLGLPLRLNSEVNKLEKRATLQQVYDQIRSDLTIASSNLEYQPKYITRASKTASLAMLAKVYLTMQNYSTAKKYADSVLMVKHELLDFNNEQLVSHNFPYKFKQQGLGNPEIIFYAESNSSYFETSYQGGIVQVKENFYNSYSENDRRKEFFYGKDEERINFTGSYSGKNPFFQGISTNEIYFISSECEARLGHSDDARKKLNEILRNRYKTGLAPIITEDDPFILLKIILNEKTKEFPRVSNIWWEDLRRLNLDPRLQKTLVRLVEGKQYSLPPNDPRYVFPISIFEIRLSGIEQNIR